jgi:hypothetical protein
MADLLCHELFTLDEFAVALDSERLDVAFGHEAVALLEPRECPLGSGSVGDEVVEGRCELHPYIEVTVVVADGRPNFATATAMKHRAGCVQGASPPVHRLFG